MLHQVLSLMTGAYVAPITPTVTSVTVARHTAGSCKSPRGTGIATAAVTRVTFAIANEDFAHYSTKIYLGGVLKATLTSHATTYDYTVSGYVYDDNVSYHPSFIFKVDVVLNSDGVTIPAGGTKTAATYTDDFGNCTGSL